MKNTILVVLVSYVFVMGCILGSCLIDQAQGDEAIELPPEILACITDIECELAADALCEQGDLEWCIEEA